MENLINEDLDLSSPDESDNEFDNESDNMILFWPYILGFY